jgi:hypothetical protein
MHLDVFSWLSELFFRQRRFGMEVVSSFRACPLHSPFCTAKDLSIGFGDCESCMQDPFGEQNHSARFEWQWRPHLPGEFLGQVRAALTESG